MKSDEADMSKKLFIQKLVCFYYYLVIIIIDNRHSTQHWASKEPPKTKNAAHLHTYGLRAYGTMYLRVMRNAQRVLRTYVLDTVYRVSYRVSFFFGKMTKGV